MDVGAKLLTAVVGTGDVILYRKLALSGKFFFGDEAPLFEFVNGYVDTYNVLPKMSTLEEQFSDLPVPQEPIRYYADQVEQRFAHRRINRALTECSDFMKDQDTFTARNTLIELMTELTQVSTRGAMAEFSAQAYDLYMATFDKKQLEMDIGVNIGWPYIDNKSGGLRPGDVMSVVGRPAQGKTWLLVNAAMHVMKTGKTALLVSMEMTMMEIMERLVALYTHFPMNHIHKYELSPAQQKKFPPALIKSKGEKGKLWVLDGHFASTVPDLFSLVNQLNPDILLVDGAYLLKHPDTRMNKFQRVDANVEEIKDRTSRMGIPTVLSYQFNRVAAQKHKKSGGAETGGLEDIGLSDSIGQLSSLVLGLYQADSVETLVNRKVQVLKGRNGEIGDFKINWNFLNMDFQQIDDDKKKEQGDLQFI